MKPLNDLTTLTQETFENWVAGLEITSLDKLAIKQYASQLRDKLSRRNMQIKELKKKIAPDFREDFTLEEIEILRDIVVNTPQSGFRMSYSLMSGICSKVITIMNRKQNEAEMASEKEAILRQDL